MPGMDGDTRAQLLLELEASQQKMVRLLESVAEIQDWQPEPVEWSFRYIAAHLARVEQSLHLHRVMGIASGEGPHFLPYSNIASNFSDVDLRDSLHKWVSTRRKLIQFVSGLSDSELRFIGFHQTVGPMTVLDALREMLEQDQGNLRHLFQLILAYQEEQREKDSTREKAR